MEVDYEKLITCINQYDLTIDQARRTGQSYFSPF